MTRNDIELLGGPSALAKMLNIKPSTVSMWFTPKEKKGLGGRIPYKHAKEIWKTKVARQKNWTLEYIIGE